MSTKNRVVKNASWIIVCRIIQSVLALVISIFVARYLGPTNYGLINYAASIIAFVLPLTQLGLSNVLVQELTNSPEEEGKIMGTSILLDLFASFFGIAGVVGFAVLSDFGNTITILVCSLYSLTLVFQAFELMQYWYQAKLLSKYMAVISLLSYVLVSGYKLFLLLTHKSVVWFAISYSLDYALIGLGLIIVYFKLGGQHLSFSSPVAKRMFSKSKHYILSSMMVVIYAQIDKIMLKFYIDEAATGIYSAAVVTAGISSFVFSAIVDSMRPVIFEDKKALNEEKYKKDTTLCYSIIIYLALLQCICMTVLSSFIIKILYSDDFAESSNVLKVVVWYTTFAYMGLVRNIWILAEGKQKYLWIINLSGAVLNVGLNALLIPLMGIIGAAIASLITQFFANVLIGFIIRPIKGNNILMFKALNPLTILRFAKSFFKKEETT